MIIPIVGTPLCGETVIVWPTLSAPPGVPHLLAAAREVAADLPAQAVTSSPRHAG